MNALRRTGNGLPTAAPTLPESEWISRAECGRRLGVPAMAVTKFCARGMPYRLSDGMVAWPDMLFWSDFFRAPQRSGNWRARHSGRSPMEELIESDARRLRRPLAEAWYRASRPARNQCWSSAADGGRHTRHCTRPVTSVWPRTPTDYR